ncbi:phosphoglycolate phosphatase [Microvirga lupini]|uniref:Phosphoglycolate phosphatase n=1 Tax=Microvirga lupini TaxID=420324 RepID=A0A7W4VPY2_9HYPH|nr:HAD family hydrolase [Microvirga lupini]MBB3021175.1 phosphoglycolate phosphatase [Microvirga lupini]
MIALFDLDGTLTDPKTGITRSVQYALERMGRPVPEADELTWMIGPPLIAGFTKLLGMADEAPEAVRLYRERFSDVGLFENEVYAGIPAVLRILQDKGIRLYVATSKPHVFARRILDHFELSRFFVGIYGSELDNRNADKRDLIRHILEQERFDPAQAVMIGDREHDAIGAKANGIMSIGVTWGYGSREELLAAGVACLVDDPQALEELVVTLTAPKPHRAATL